MPFFSVLPLAFPPISVLNLDGTPPVPATSMVPGDLIQVPAPLAIPSVLIGPWRMTALGGGEALSRSALVLTWTNYRGVSRG